LGGCASQQPTQPLIYHYGTPWATAEVNGVGGVFLLDTGASVTVLDSEFAERAGVLVVGEHEVIGTAGSITAGSGLAGEIAMDGQTHYERLVSIQNLAGFRAPGGRQQAGLIGCDFFLDYNVVFDMRRSILDVTTTSAPKEGNMVQYPMMLNGGTPMIHVFFPGYPEGIPARFDTGSGYADEGMVYLDMTRSRAEPILRDRLNRPPDATTQVISITGTDTLNIYDFGPVRVLGKTLDTVRVVVRDQPRGAFTDESTILITGSLLRQFDRVEMDFPRRTIWVSAQ
jgi:hypothetical protein